MSNDYFTDGTDYTAPEGNVLARATDVKNLSQAVDTGFDRLPGKDELHQDRVNYAVDTGAANALVVTLATSPASYVAGLRISAKVAATNTGASTVNANALGAVAIKR
jgi:hypothetical protein